MWYIIPVLLATWPGTLTLSFAMTAVSQGSTSLIAIQSPPSSPNAEVRSPMAETASYRALPSATWLCSPHPPSKPELYVTPVNSVLQSLACMAPPLPDNHPPLLGLLAHQPVRLVSHRPRPLSASDLLSLRFLLSVQGLLCSPELTRHGLRHLMFGAWLQCCPSGIFPTFLQLRENGFLYKHTISRSDVSTAHCQLERI